MIEALQAMADCMVRRWTSACAVQDGSMAQRVLCVHCAPLRIAGRAEQSSVSWGTQSGRCCSQHTRKRSGFQLVEPRQLSKSALHTTAEQTGRASQQRGPDGSGRHVHRPLKGELG